MIIWGLSRGLLACAKRGRFVQAYPSCSTERAEVYGIVSMGSSLSVLDFVQLGSTMALRSVSRLGSALAVYGMSRLGSALSLLDYTYMGSSLALRSYVRSARSLRWRGGGGVGARRRLAEINSTTFVVELWRDR